MSERIDPRHATKRSSLSALSVLFLVLGFALFAYGLVQFGSGFFRPSSEFFADPHRVMDEDRRSAFTGIICIFIGAVGLMAGAKGLFFARAGSVLRYAAAETAPVTTTTFNYVADGTQEGVAKIARAVRQGAPSTSGETIKVRCRGCGYLESEDAKFCSGCGAVV